MNFRQKIISLELLEEKALEWQTKKKSIVVCKGNFNVVHPGHLRFLEYAGALGDILVVLINSDGSLSEELLEHFFDEDERARGVGAVAFVDNVVVLDEEKVFDLFRKLRPNIYVKGREFRYDEPDPAEESFMAEIGCKIVYDSGEVTYSSGDLLFSTTNNIKEQKLNQFRESCERHDVQLEGLLNVTSRFKGRKIIVIGDTIVDQYVACDALGMSAEAPVLVLKEIEGREFLGGAGIVACHLSQLGGNVHYFTAVGNDTVKDFVLDKLLSYNVAAHHLVDESRPTSFKIRYIVDRQKLLRVSRLRDHEIAKSIESQLINQIEQEVDDAEGIVFSDFSYGVVTDRVFQKIKELAKLRNIPIFCDSQSSSQISDVGKFNDVELITPTEREARISLADKESGLERLGHDLLLKTNNSNVVITLGAKGLLTFANKKIKGKLHSNSQHFPSLSANPVDVAGAGDALLSAMALSLICKASVWEASALGACLASIQVERTGNIPISATELDVFVKKVFENGKNYNYSG